MKTKPVILTSIGVLALLSMFLISCKKDLVSEDLSENDSMDSNLSLTLKGGTTDLPGRTLAANCFQCHGTNGYAGELKIAGESASEIVGELTEMKSKDPRSNIMNVHARAYTADEIKLIGDYFSKQ
jgi:sulfide dehydrogenase cytochrome subunit